MEFEVVKDLRQHHLESWDDEYWQRRDAIKREQIGRSTDEGLIVRAALAAGWFGDGLRVDADERVKNMSPSEVLELATIINSKREVARAIDPKLHWQLVSTYSGMAGYRELYKRLGALKRGVMVAVRAGDSGELEILSDSTMSLTSTTPATLTKERQVIPSNGQSATLTNGNLYRQS